MTTEKPCCIMQIEKRKHRKKGGSNLKLTLKALRMNKGYTQEKAASLIGVSVDTLANYEKGLTYPDIPILKKIEDIYETKYDNINFF